MAVGSLALPLAAAVTVAGLVVLATTDRQDSPPGAAPTRMTTRSTPSPSVEPPPPTGPATGPAERLQISTPLPPERGPAATEGAAPSGVPPARRGHAAASQRTTFIPTTLRLVRAGSASASARVEQVDTADGELTLPSDPHRVGWWVAGALAGDAFGSVVVAGHIDSRASGIGFFARLLAVRPGDQVVLGNGRLHQKYTVGSTRRVAKAGLSTKADPFTQNVAGRLVLITCTGRFDPVARRYDENLVVVAIPDGAVVAAPSN